MNNVFKALAVTTALFAATPALAQSFTGPRVEAGAVLTNTNVSSSETQYGANVGYDVGPTQRLRIGGELTTNNLFRNNREIGGNLRLGYVVAPRLMLYGKAGYADRRLYNTTLKGVSYGGGAEFQMTDRLYLKGEYRRTNFNRGVNADTGFVGIGFRL